MDITYNNDGTFSCPVVTDTSKVVFANHGISLLTQGATSEDTVLRVSDGSRFSSLAPGEYFYAVLRDPTTFCREIVKVTARFGNVLTVARAQEGTTARGFNSGSFVEQAMTAASLDAIRTEALRDAEKAACNLVAASAGTLYGLVTDMVGVRLERVCPIGSVLLWMSSTIPTYFLELNGQFISKTVYADLYGKWGEAFGSEGDNFRIPDARGYFLRFRDNGAGRDPDVASRKNQFTNNVESGGRSGSVQDAAVKAHTHGMSDNYKVSYNHQGGALCIDISGPYDAMPTQSYGGKETRPTNVYMTAIVRAL